MDNITTTELTIEPYLGFNDLAKDIKRDILPQATMMFGNWSQRVSGKEHILPKGSKLQQTLQEQFVQYILNKVTDDARSCSSAPEAKRFVDQVEDKILYTDYTSYSALRKPPNNEKIPTGLELGRLGQEDKQTRIDDFLSNLGIMKDGKIDERLLDIYIAVRHFELVLAQVDAEFVKNADLKLDASDTDSGLFQIMSTLKQQKRISGIANSGFAVVGQRAAFCYSNMEGESIKVDPATSVQSTQILNLVINEGNRLSNAYNQVRLPVANLDRIDVYNK